MVKLVWKQHLDDLSDCFSIRKEVFVIEQGFSEKNEFDYIDNDAYHLCVYNESDGSPVATARLFGKDGAFKCGRICILKEHREKGIGNVIMQAIGIKAMLLGAKSIELDAQVTAVPFYKNFGYEPVGEEFLDEHCPHIKMLKQL